MSDLIDRRDALNAMWKALYEYEDKTEKQFQESENLDVSEWIMNDRLWVQNGHNLCVNVVTLMPTAQPETNCSEFPNNSDTISRQAAIDALGEEPPVWYDGEDEIAERNQWRRAVKAIKAVPSAQSYTEAEIQRMQDLEQTEIDKAFELGKEEGRKEAQPEPKEIGYGECANALLKMWMDNVLTDGEYNRIMDKLNKHWGIWERKDD